MTARKPLFFKCRASRGFFGSGSFSVGYRWRAACAAAVSLVLLLSACTEKTREEWCAEAAGAMAAKEACIRDGNCMSVPSIAAAEASARVHCEWKAGS